MTDPHRSSELADGPLSVPSVLRKAAAYLSALKSGDLSTEDPAQSLWALADAMENGTLRTVRLDPAARAEWTAIQARGNTDMATDTGQTESANRSLDETRRLVYVAYFSRFKPGHAHLFGTLAHSLIHHLGGDLTGCTAGQVLTQLDAMANRSSQGERFNPADRDWLSELVNNISARLGQPEIG